MARYVVVGLGRFGRTLVDFLTREGKEVIAIDKNPDLVEDVKECVARAVSMDATDEDALAAQELDKVDVLIACIGEDFEANQLVTVLAKKLGVKRVITRVGNPLQMKIMKLVGADEVICPEEESAKRLAQKLTHPNIMAYFELADGHSLIEVKSPKHFEGRSIRELDLRKKYHINLIAVKHIVTDEKGNTIEKVDDLPTPDYVVQAGDILVVVGKDEDVERIAR
jgi:trk system potassium uptake protein TrkA